MKFTTSALFELCKSGEVAAFDFISNLKERSKNYKFLSRKTDETDVLNIIENLGLLFTNLFMCKTKRHALFIILMYLKTHYSTSVLKKCIDFMVESDLFSTKEVDDNSISGFMSTDSFTEDIPDWEEDFHMQSEPLPEWLRTLKDCQRYWDSSRSSPVFDKVSKLISMFAALGLCELSNFNLDFNGVRIFSIGAHRKHVSAPDLGAAILDTIVFFAEGAYKYFQTGSINHFLYTDQDAQDFEESYYKIYELSNYVRCGNLSKFGDGSLTENDYDRLLTNAIERGTIIMRGLKGPERTLFATKYERLRKFRSDFIQYRTSGKLRIAPYGLYLHGDSSVGKSYLSALLMRLILKMNDYSAADELIMSLNASDKFMSNAKAFINGILLDDVGNTNPQFAQEAFTQRLLDLINNVPYYANMAEIEQKGKTALEPLVVVLTSNIMLDKLAAIYSNNVMSIIRRCNIHITVHVKEAYRINGFQLNSDKVREDFKDDIYPDVWEFETFYADNSDKKEGELKPLINRRINLQELIALLAVQTRDHYARQKHIIEVSQDLAGKLDLCKECRLPKVHCHCGLTKTQSIEETTVVEEVTKTQSVRETVVVEEVPEDDDCPDLIVTPDDDDDDDDIDEPEDDVFPNLVVPPNDDDSDDEEDFEDQLGFSVKDKLRDTIKWISEHKWLNRLYVLLNSIDFMKWCEKVIYQLQKRGVWHGESTMRICGHITMFLSLIPLVLGWFFAIFGFLVLTACHFYLMNFYLKYRRALELVSKYRHTVQVVFTNVRNRRAATFFASCAAIALAYKLFRRYHSFWKEQGNLFQPTVEEIKARDAEANPWVGAYVQKVPQLLNVQCDQQQLLNAVEANLTYARFPKHPDGVSTCNMLFIKSNLAVVPQHIWYADQIPFEAYHANRKDFSVDQSAAHKRGHGILSRSCAYFIPDTDMCVVRVPGCGTWRDISKFLPDSPVHKTNATLIYRDVEGHIMKLPTFMYPQHKIRVGKITYSGHTYTLPEKTFNGLCVATLVADTKPAVVAGIHLAGNGYKGASGSLIKSHIENAVRFFDNKISTFVPHSDGAFPEKQCGVEAMPTGTVHPKSCVNYLPTSGVINVYGSCKGRATARSQVVKTPISDDVAEICGQPNKWGPPPMHPWKPFYVNLLSVTDPSLDMPGDALEWACNDYLEPFKKLCRSAPWRDELKPLTELQAVSGIDGTRFIDAMVMNTSPGYPLSGTKKDYTVALNPDEHPGTSCPMEFTDEVKQEVDRLVDCYLQGLRGYPCFKGAQKDEVVLKTKEKTRVFYAAPVALQLLVRQYFLPALRLMSMNPIDSECAVGINAFGPEWDQLAKHMAKFGKDRIFAGDYKSYDTRMPAQITLAAYNVLIKICEMSGNYTERDLKIMRGIATDCCYPFVALNGDLVSFNGVHISGINVTAHVGSIANSLLKRCGFYTLYPDSEEDKKKWGCPVSYRDYVADMNYGDDFKNSVSKYADWFNFITYQAFLAEHGITLTMPDKKSEAVKYMKDEDADFLKRRNVYNEELDQIMGALDKDSIFKSLHNVCKSKSVTLREQSQMNIDGALREMFLHGESEYEKLRAQLKEVALRNDIRGCLMLDVTYRDHMEEYKRKYYGAPPLEDFDEEVVEFERQSGFEGKEYFQSRYIRKRDKQFVYSSNSGFLHEYEDDTVKIVRRHKSSNGLEGFEPLPNFFNIPKCPRTQNQIDLLYKMAHKPCLYQSVLWGPKQRPLGDIDLGFYLGGCNEFAIFECKKSYHKGTSSKTRRQVEAQVSFLAHYNPRAIFHGFLIRGDKCEHIASSQPATKKVLRLELFKSSYSGNVIGKEAIGKFLEKTRDW